MITVDDLAAFALRVEQLVDYCSMARDECNRLKALLERESHAVGCLFTRYGVCDCGFLYQAAQQGTAACSALAGRDLDWQQEQLAKLDSHS